MRPESSKRVLTQRQRGKFGENDGRSKRNRCAEGANASNALSIPDSDALIDNPNAEMTGIETEAVEESAAHPS
jgi:hypothetical protein